MRADTLLFLAASLSWAVAQDTAVCTAKGLVSCVGAPLTTTCADYPCACSQLSIQTACYTSLCPGIAIPTGVLSAYSAVCSPGSQGGGSGGGSGAVTTTAAAAGGTAASGSTATAAQTAATSKAAANAGLVVPAGGVLAAALGMVAFL